MSFSKRVKREKSVSDDAKTQRETNFVEKREEVHPSPDGDH